MKHTESTFNGLDDVQIYYQGWLPDEEIRGILLIVHGFGEHSGRYSNVVDILKDLNIAIYALDHRGHGKSEGNTNYVNRFTDYLDDLSTFEQIIKEKYKDLPYFMLGHSMGSLIATHYIAQHKNQNFYDSLILSGSGADFGPGINKITIFIARILSFILPKLEISSNLDPNFISHDESVVEEYINDPLVNHNKITTRLASEMMKYTGSMKEAAKNVKIPTFIQIGSEDEAFAPESREPLLDAIANENKELKIYEGFRHEVYNEVSKEVPLNDLKMWIQKFL